MKRLFILFGILLSLFGVSCHERPLFKSVDVVEFERLVNDDAYVVLDVRTSAEHDDGYIEGTDYNIDVLADDFVEKVKATLPKDKAVALYCRSGNRSKRAAELLVESGYSVVELATGYNGWVAAGK